MENSKLSEISILNLVCDLKDVTEEIEEMDEDPRNNEAMEELVKIKNEIIEKLTRR